MGEIASFNNVDIWWEDYGEKSNTSVLLIMGANASALYWDRKFIEELVANDLHVVIFDNRDVGKSSWFNSEPLFVKLAKFLPHAVSKKLVSSAFKSMVDDDGKFAMPDGKGAKYDLNDMAKDAICLMDHLGIEQAHIVGASMGGMITQIIGLEYPERALSLTPIMSSPGVGDASLSGIAPSLMEGMQQMFLLNIQGRYLDGVVELYRALAGSRFPFDEVKFRNQAEPIMAHGHNAYAGHGDAVGAGPSRLNRLAEISLPTLVIHGTEDPILPLDHGMALANNIAGATTFIMEGVGHEIPEALMPEIVREMLALFQKASK
jgi:pimeloyl-ACP methyl ester carboxylesterase